MFCLTCLLRRLLSILLLLIIIRCSGNHHEKSNDQLTSKEKTEQHIIAKTITYDVIIKSSSNSSKSEIQNLKQLKRKQYIDSLFDQIYKGNMIVYDFYSEKQISIRDLRKTENSQDFHRNNIGKIQFTERWYYHSDNYRIEKEVVSMVLGYEDVSQTGEIRYKPIFKVYFD